MVERNESWKAIQTVNLQLIFREAILPVTWNLANHPETAAVALLGGTARGERNFVDCYSDIDLSLYLDIPGAEKFRSVREFKAHSQSRLPHWLPPYVFYVQVGGQRREVNVHQSVLQIEDRDDYVWDTGKREVYTHNVEILMERNQCLTRLIAKKCVWDSEAARVQIIRNLSQLPWYGWINPINQYHRGFPWHSHLLIHRAIELAVETFYLLHEQDIPHCKWRIQQMQTFCGENSEFVPLAQEALLAADNSMDCILRRTGLIRKMERILFELGLKKGLYDQDTDLFDWIAKYGDEDKQLLYEAQELEKR